MKNVDILIIGAATTGSYFARKMAEQGFNVLVIEKLREEKLGTKYDIFHISEKDFARFGLPMPEEGCDKAFCFSESSAYSSFGKHPKPCSNPVIGLHLHEYTLRMNRWALDAGAEIIYSAEFNELIFDENQRIIGAEYTKDGITYEVNARLVADCTGIPSAARTRLPDSALVENFKITDDEKFYVVLRYVNYFDPSDYITGSRSWTFYKSWEAPQHNKTGAILGIGSNFSFDFADKIYAKFASVISLPKHSVDHIERGTTPYRRPPYSFIDDGFIVMGDAACLTKPSAGEGVTSSMVQIDIAADVITPLLLNNEQLSAENMWSINKRYVQVQGRAFASQLAVLVGAVATNGEENDFFFEKDIIFSKKSFAALGEGKELSFSISEIIGMGIQMLGGVLSGRLRPSTIRSLLRAMSNSGKISRLYEAYPDDINGFAQWKISADELWKRCGTMADHAAEMLEAR